MPGRLSLPLHPIPPHPWPCLCCRHHEAGNVGVEHAAPAVVRAALAAPRRSDPQRSAFSREQLLAWGLVAELGERVGCAWGECAKGCRLGCASRWSVAELLIDGGDMAIGQA